MTDRGSIIKIGENDYELILTTRATKEIAKRYGGLENLGDRLMKSENFEMALDEIIWLITLLANQSVMIYNLKNPNSKRCLPIRKHRGAREKRYSFGYAVFLILALMK